MNEHKCKKCGSENITWIEIAGDYDWVIMWECSNCEFLYHRFTWDEVDLYIQKEEYSPAMFFKDWDLIAYSQWRASWLELWDDFTKAENLLWWTRWKSWREEQTFKPLKDMTISHMKAIKADYEKGMRADKRIINYITKTLWEIIDADTLKK